MPDFDLDTDRLPEAVEAVPTGRGPRAGSVALVLFLVGIGSALGNWANTPAMARRVPIHEVPMLAEWLQKIGIGPLTWMACAAASPLLVWLTVRFPIDRARWTRTLPLHAVVSAVLALAVEIGYFRLAYAPGPPADVLRFFVVGSFFTVILPFWLAVAALHALRYYRQVRTHELAVAQLRAGLAEARLEALTTQLRPHFLFNTLQAISTLLYRDVHAADAMLTELSDLLRQTLRYGDQPEVSLGEELGLLAHYVALYRARLEYPLAFDTDVPPGLRDARIPFFLLQPLVENALLHGAGRNAGPGRIEVQARHEGADLHLAVHDDGPGMAAPLGHGEGTGLANTRKRLAQRYGAAARLTLEHPPGGGLTVHVFLPYHAPLAPHAQRAPADACSDRR